MTFFYALVLTLYRHLERFPIRLLVEPRAGQRCAGIIGLVRIQGVYVTKYCFTACFGLPSWMYQHLH